MGAENESKTSIGATVMSIFNCLTATSIATKALEKIPEFIIDKGIDTAKEAFDHHQFQKRAEAELSAFYARLSNEERFDKEVLHQNLMNTPDVIRQCFLADSVGKRENAMQTLLQTSYQCTHADTPEKRRAVSGYARIMLKLNEDAIRATVSEADTYLAGRVVDELTQRIRELSQPTDTEFQTWLNGQTAFLNPKDDPFYYCNDILTFRGRKSELDKLQQFLDADQSILWTAITGQGGAGKSKLLYHFTNQLQCNPFWKVLWLNQARLTTITGLSNWRTDENLLIVVDYVGIVAEKLGAFLSALNSATHSIRPDKVRFVLLEREGLGQRTQMNPLWYTEFIKTDHRCVENTGWSGADSSPIWSMDALTDEDLKAIASDYATHKGQTLTDTQREELLGQLKRIDHQSGTFRPLILIFLTDALITNQDFRHWDIDRLLKELVERYCTHWKTLCNDDFDLFYVVKLLMALATASNGLDLRQKPQCLADEDWKRLQALKRSKQYAPLRDGLNGRDAGNQLLPLEPDLLGEAFVLEWMKDLLTNDETDVIKQFSAELWREESELDFAVFLDRCGEDFATELRFSETIIKVFGLIEPQESEFCLVLYAALLFNLSNDCPTLEEKQAVIDLLCNLYQAHSDNPEVVTAYASGLFNLSNACPTLEQKQAVIDLLCSLYHAHRDNPEVVTQYAKGLVNHSNACPALEQKQATIDLLFNLYQAHRDNPAVVTQYAKGLVNLSCAFPTLEQTQAMIDLLCSLYHAHRDNPAVVTEYAKGLFNLSNDCPMLEEKQAVIDLLCSLYYAHRDNPAVVTQYAKGLFNLFVSQCFESQSVNSLIASIVKFLASLDTGIAPTPQQWLENSCRMMIHALLSEGTDYQTKHLLAPLLQNSNFPEMEKQAVLEVLQELGLC